MKPVASIIIPTFNHRVSLGEAIACSLAQTVPCEGHGRFPSKGRSYRGGRSDVPVFAQFVFRIGSAQCINKLGDLKL